MKRRLPLLLVIGVLLAGCAGVSGEPLVTETPPPPAPTDEPAPPPSPTVIPAAETSEPTATSEPPADRGENVGNADVTFVRASQQADGTWTFSVTVSHPDTGWEDYADGWDVVLPDGSIVKPDPDSPFTRLLTHPHVDEQPFTRSQSGIAIPEG